MNHQTLTDRMAISLSFLCTLHCLALPVLLAVVPSLTALSLDDEAFHLWMLVAVVPISGFALAVGYRKHNSYPVLVIGSLGLLVMILAVLLGHDWLGDAGEKMLTVLGASVVALAHYLNQRFCREQDCRCHE